MSTIYVFNKTESVVTASASSTGASGANMLSTDSLLIYNAGPNTVNQTLVGAVSGLGRLEFISTNTSSSLTTFPTLAAYGTSVFPMATATSCGLVAVLPAPPSAGLYKTIISGTGTATGIQVVCPSTNSYIMSTGASSGTIVANESIFLGQSAAYIDLVSISTAAWMVTGRSVGAFAFTTTTTT